MCHSINQKAFFINIILCINTKLLVAFNCYNVKQQYNNEYK